MKALDWGTNNGLLESLRAFLELLSQLLTPISELIQAIVDLFSPGTDA